MLVLLTACKKDTDISDDNYETLNGDETVSSIPTQGVSTSPEDATNKIISSSNEDDNDTAALLSATPASCLEQLGSYQFEVEENTYQLPITLGQLTKKGWTLKTQLDEDYDTSTSLDPLEEVYTMLTKGDKSLPIVLINPKPHKSNHYEDFLICQIQGDVKIPGGITLNSTVDEVKKVYGNPVHTSGDSNFSVLQYKTPIHRFTEDNRFKREGIVLNANKGKIEEIILSYVNINLEDLVMKINQPIPYEIPAKLGTDFFSFTFAIDGKFYRLPSPLSVFINQGFHIKGTATDEHIYSKQLALRNVKQTQELLAPGKSLSLFLEKKDKILVVQIKNEYDSYQYLIDCTVVNVKFLPLKSGITYNLPEDIDIGTTQEELIAFLSNVPYAHYDRQQLEAYYNIYTYSNYEDWVRYEVYDLDVSDIQEDGSIPYRGKTTFDLINGSVKEINYTRYSNDYIGYTVEDDLISTDNTQEEKYNYSNEEMIDFLCYNKKGYSYWSETNYAMVFDKSGYFSAYDAAAGNPWILRYGDTADGTASYTIDSENQLIIVEDYQRTITIHYKILTSFEIEIKLEGSNEIFHFYKR
ncbi:hypothetical protein I5677_12625 [Mobilitalea sibirica]|uniref:Uncharacterized protein n=1 Tax=Mobilitalea sibirica TaxID=1462919 RepID=A0A8J7H081_9FIRM|nr:hypothetical protein [Mobilitalea sibirica]MBH1941739.1 hypothetical protein [Mobilitalea sibirica]